MVQATKILLDTADAIKKLDQLKEKFSEVSDEVDELEDSGDGSFFETLEEGAGSLAPKLTKVASGARTVATAVGPMGAVIGVAAASVAALVTNLINLPEVFRDTRAEMEAFTAAAERQLDIQNEISGVSDALVNSRTARELRSLRLEGAQLSARQGELTASRQSASEELKIFKDRLKQEEKLFKDSIKRRRDAQKILDEEQDSVERVRSDPRLTEGQRAIELAARAEQEAQKGNLELAQKFRDAAQEVTDELGGHVFFQERVDQATDSIVANAKRQVSEEDKVQTAIKGRVSQLEAEISLREENLKLIAREAAAITKAQGQVTLQRGQARERRFEERNQQGRDEAGRTVRNVATILNREISDGGRSAAENIRDSLKQSLGNFTRAQTTRAQSFTVGEAFDELPRIAEVLKDAQATPNEILSLAGPLERLASNLGALETFRGRTGSESFDADIDQLQSILNLGRRALRAAEQGINADADPFQPLREGVAGIQPTIRTTQQLIEDLGGAASGATDKLNGVGQTAVPTTRSPQQQVAQATATPAAAAPAAAATVTAPVTQDIDVTVQIKGGMIDNETIDKVAERVQRILRRGTGQGAG